MKGSRVLFFISNICNAGGTERVTTLVANGLINKGFDVHIFSLIKGDKPFYQLDSKVNLHILGIEDHTVKKSFFKICTNFRGYVKRHNIDTCIIVDTISTLFSIVALCGLNVKKISWEHFTYNFSLDNRMRVLGRKIATKYCDYVVTLTYKDKEIWASNFLNIRAEMITIPNPNSYENIENIPSLKYKTILAVGRLTYQKGFDLLLNAWSEVCKEDNDWILKVVGSGEDEEKLKLQVKELSLDNKVEFIPATKDIDKYYKTSSFLCMSSRFEGFGMVLLEAQAFGLPLVSFDCECGPSDIINNDINGYLVKSGDVLSLSRTISIVLGLSDEKYTELSRNSILNANEYTIDKIIPKWIEILK